MKRTIVAVLMAAILCSGLLVGCGEDTATLRGSGNLDTQEMDFSGFTGIEAGTAFEIEIMHSDSYSVSITADDNLFGYIRVSKDGKTLKIGLKPGTQVASATLQARINMPALYELDLSGAARGTAEGFGFSDDFTLDLSGASTIDMHNMSVQDAAFDISGASSVTGDITAGDAEFTLSGASTVRLEGSASDMLIDASGASVAELGSFSVHNADVKLSGGSQATVNLDGTLDADLSGASSLGYIGEPTMGVMTTAGASTVSRVE